MEKVAISALQHYAFCPRQAALIHQEGYWFDNYATAAGTLFHKKVHQRQHHKRSQQKQLFALDVASEELGLVGQCDLVEIEENEHKKIVKVVVIEFKQGAVKKHRADEIQLCAQALCLEEQLKIPLEQGFIYYRKTQKRHLVCFDEKLRQLTLATVHKLRELLQAQQTPAAIWSSACSSCSMQEVCLPKMSLQATAYRKKQLAKALV